MNPQPHNKLLLMGFMAIAVCLLPCSTAFPVDAPNGIAELSPHLGKTPALVVFVGTGAATDVEAIRTIIEQTSWTVFCRGTTAKQWDGIRDWAAEKEVLGSRVYIVEDKGASLYLANNLADAVWIAPGVKNAPDKEEVLRVLHPGGVCLDGGKTYQKPIPAGTDSWSHPYHGPD